MHTYSLHSDIAKLFKVLHLPCMWIQYIQVMYVPAVRAYHLAIGSIYSKHVYKLMKPNVAERPAVSCY